MRRLVKTGLIILIILGLCFFSLCFWGIRLVTRSLPDTTGTLILAGPDSEIQVFRDGYSIPHIFSENKHDLFFAQGFVTAQDRLWQMDLWRRASQGRLSEIFGRVTVGMDSLMLTVGIYRTAQQSSNRLSFETHHAYQAYADGINAYIEKNRNALPIEFIMLNYIPSPWKIEDSISIIKWLDWHMTIGWKEDMVLGTLVETFGWDRIKNLFPELEQPIHPLSDETSRPMAELLRTHGKRASRTFLEIGFGSNSWVVSGNRSVTGQPLLANDPHLSLECPSIFYENHLAGGGLNVTGFSIPGLPAVICGHNDHIAWGLTNLMADNLDLFEITLNPYNHQEYLYEGTYKSLEIIEEHIPVRMDSTIDMIIYKTHYGPIVSHVLPDFKENTPVLAMQWTGQEIHDPGLAFLHLNQASDWDSFRNALRIYENTPQYFVFADDQGNIGLQAAGKIPVRPYAGYSLPKSGSHADFVWREFLDFNDLPFEKNPDSGFLAAANHSVNTNKSPMPIPQFAALPSRIRRIRTILSEKELFSVRDFKDIQSDLMSHYNRELLQLVLSVIEHSSSFDSSHRGIMNELKNWDGLMKPGSLPAAFCQIFIDKCLNNLFGDEMGDDLFLAFTDIQSLCLSVLQRVLQQDNSPWFDNIKTSAQIETRENIVGRSFEQTISLLQEEMGQEWRKWSWGKIHTLMFKHPLGQNALLMNALCLGPFHVGGCGTSLNCFGHPLRTPYHVTWGPAARMILDLNHWDNSVSVNSTGQSGQPLDPHYRDQVPLYINSLYHPNLADTSKIKRSGWDRLILSPGGNDD